MTTTFRMEDQNITMVKGDTMSFNVVIEPKEYELDDAVFSVTKDGTEQIEKTLEDGITLVGEGTYAVRLAPEDTSSLDAGFYHYELRVMVDDDAYTLLKGTLELEESYVE